MVYKLSFFCLLPIGIMAQHDTISLQQVEISDHLLNANQTQHIIRLNADDRNESQALLSDIIQFKTPLYLKQNGQGMVSSPSFRGTTASQTAIVWNGINVNSATHGQIDFNQFLTGNYQQLDVKLGGGSIAHGSGAIGGSVHLQNDFKFRQGWENDAQLSYGSFDTYNLQYHTHYSNDQLSAQFSFNHYSTENDYSTPNEAGKNLNGEYKLNQFNLGIAYRFNNFHHLKFISETNFGDRHFSLATPFEMPTKYETWNHRFLTEWNYQKSSFQSNVKLAYLKEQSDYFANINSDYFSRLDVDTYVVKYLAQYAFNPNIKLSFLADYTHNIGEGNSIAKQERDILGAGFVFNHRIGNKFSYDLSVRKEDTKAYQSPLLYSVGLAQQWNESWKTRLHFSKNFRIPTYNDLYWEASGNPDLKTETSYQYEMGNDLVLGDFGLNWNIFYNDIQDLIQWIPSGNGSLWYPVNQESVKTYGTEFFVNYQWRNLSLSGLFTYTKTLNEKTDKALMYTPNHQAKASLSYQYKNLKIFGQGLYTGEVFTTTDESNKLDAYWLLNFGANYQINSAFGLQAKVNNVLDKAYESMPNRWMPGINYQITLDYKF